MSSHSFVVNKKVKSIALTHEITVMYPPLLQLRIVSSIIPTYDMLHDTNTTEHTIDTVLRSLTPVTGTVTTITTTTVIVGVVVAIVATMGVSGWAGTAIANCYRSYCYWIIRIHRYQCR